MANEIPELIEQASKNVEVEGSAVLVINGIEALIQEAVAAAIANGATAEQLVPLTDLTTRLQTSATALGDAIAARTGASRKR